jgi:hypothetical protein
MGIVKRFDITKEMVAGPPHVYEHPSLIISWNQSSAGINHQLESIISWNHQLESSAGKIISWENHQLEMATGNGAASPRQSSL